LKKANAVQIKHMSHFVGIPLEILVGDCDGICAIGDAFGGVVEVESDVLVEDVCEVDDVDAAVDDEVNVVETVGELVVGDGFDNVVELEVDDDVEVVVDVVGAVVVVVAAVGETVG